MDPIERLHAEYRWALLQLQAQFRREKQAFFEAFKDEIMSAHRVVGRTISATTQDAAERLEQSQLAREKALLADMEADILMLIQQARKEAGLGNLARAAELAELARRQGELAVAQAEREAEAWARRVVR